MIDKKLAAKNEGERVVIFRGLEIVVRQAPRCDTGLRMARRIADATGAPFEQAFHAMKAANYDEVAAIESALKQNSQGE